MENTAHDLTPLSLTGSKLEARKTSLETKKESEEGKEGRIKRGGWGDLKE